MVTVWLTRMLTTAGETFSTSGARLGSSWSSNMSGSAAMADELRITIRQAMKNRVFVIMYRLPQDFGTAPRCYGNRLNGR